MDSGVGSKIFKVSKPSVLHQPGEPLGHRGHLGGSATTQNESADKGPQFLSPVLGVTATWFPHLTPDRPLIIFLFSKPIRHLSSPFPSRPYFTFSWKKILLFFFFFKKKKTNFHSVLRFYMALTTSPGSLHTCVHDGTVENIKNT